ncbi:MAG: hypothetical protein JST96_05590 [Bacteroidetes bacterium]|nr:hypothetical protein [Bacteroidota bacterium]
MTQKIMMVLLFSIILYNAFAQSKQNTTSGIYVNASDFINHKLTYQINCNNTKDKMRLNDFFGSSTGYVLSNGEKHAFNKNKVYGYLSCSNKNYRFFQHSSYEILDTAGFFIYYQYREEEINKGKEPVKKDEYFFSATSNGPVQLLTIDNLKKAFPGNDKFHYALDETFRSDKDLIAYDSFRRSYKIKYLYNESLK